jgi:hypothetical protein
MTSPRRIKSTRVPIVALALWVTISVLWAELVGAPHLYGWPLLVLRPEDCSQPDAWVWIVDLIGACVLLAATWLVASWCFRTIARGFQFRLSTLLGVAATVAVIVAVWRWSADHLADVFIRFGDQDEDEMGTSAMLDLTGFLVWSPPWILPMRLVVRLGVVSGLGCAVYVAGCLFANAVRRCLGVTRRRYESDKGIGSQTDI